MNICARTQGVPQYTVDSSLLTFVNHGCNGTFNLAEPTPFNEFTIDIDDLDVKPPSERDSYEFFGVYNPCEDRRINKYSIVVSNHGRTIEAGQELLDNYIDMAGSDEYYRENIIELRTECSGALGDVEKWQLELEGVTASTTNE